MAPREPESMTTGSLGEDVNSDPHSLLFGDDDGRDQTGEFEPVRPTRAERRRSRGRHGTAHRRRRRGRLFMLLILLIVAAVALLVVPRVIDFFRVADYSGNGAGEPAVQVTVTPGNLAHIGQTLKNADVVKSVKAFTDAASGNSKAQSIQPGVYNLHKHMSGAAALAALLDPGTRDRSHDALVIEGATIIDVAATVNRVCGAGQAAATQKALSSPANLGIPVSYKSGSKMPASAEGFLYPATYTLDPNCKPADALQRMVSRFIQQDRATHFAATAQKIGQTPYSALIIASIAQSEAKFSEDMPKVVRTILNRIKAHKALQFDSTSAYACKLKGTDPKRCIYNQINSPYNTYTHTGLPPTPIDNPGASALHAAVHPASGNWFFFVNKDKSGHLFFTNRASAFEKARQKCVKNHWGCG